MNRTLCLSLCALCLVSFAAAAETLEENRKALEEYSNAASDFVINQRFNVSHNSVAPEIGAPETLKNVPIDLKKYSGNVRNVPVRACDGKRFYWMTADGKYVVKNPFSNGTHSFWDSPDIEIGSPAFQQRLEKACANPNDEFTKPLNELQERFKKDLR